MQRFEEGAVAFHKIHNVCFLHRCAVHPDALAEIHQVGRRVESYPVAGGLQHGGQGVRARTLAVGAAYVDGGVLPVRMAQMFVQRTGVVQSFFVSTGAHLLEHRGARIQIG